MVAHSSFEADIERALIDMGEARLALVDAIGPLSRADLDREQRGGWSARRVLQHVIDSELVYAKLLAHMRGAEAPDDSPIAPVDGQDAAAKLMTVRAMLKMLVDGIDEETLYRLVRFGREEYSPLSVLQNVAAHDHEHLRQIAEIVRADAPPSPIAAGQLDAAAGVTIRAAAAHDLAGIVEIYNHYIINTAITFDIEPYSVEQRRAWFEQFAPAGRHRLLVAESGGAIVGYAGSHQFRAKAAYDTTVETTVYCAPGSERRGIGGALYASLFDALAGEGIRSAIGGITVPNNASIALHERFGFVRAGLMHDVGFKFGRYWDVLWMERVFGAMS